MTTSNDSSPIESLQMRSCAKRTSSIIIRNKLRETNLVTAFENLDHSIDSIEDGYPAWHPAPLSFRAMVFSFVFVEITGDSYADFSRRLTRQPEVATILGFQPGARRISLLAGVAKSIRQRRSRIHPRCRPLRHQGSPRSRHFSARGSAKVRDPQRY